MYNSKYELLILDYGGVHSFEYRLTNIEKIIHDVFGKTPGAEEKEQVADLSRKFAANALTTNQYVKGVAKILDTPTPRPEDFENTIISLTNPPSEGMRRLVASVKNAGIKVSLLSNMYAFEVIKTKPWGRYDGFDYISFSSEAHMTKHEPRFFKATLEHFNITADRVLFVDDILVYVETAKSAGLHTLHADHLRFTHAEELARAIREELFGAVA